MIDSMEIAEYAIENYHALQKPWELSKFLDLITHRNPKVIYEIGVSLGGSLWAMAAALPGERVFVSIDLPNGPFGGSVITTDQIGDLVLGANPEALCIVVRGDSKTVDLPYPEYNPDLVFIDGDHTFNGVLADWNRYSLLVEKGKGVVAFHDIVEHPTETRVQVDMLWEELHASHLYSTYEIIESNGAPWAGIGIVYL